MRPSRVRFLAAPLVVMVLLVSACATRRPELPISTIPQAERPYLLDPASGYPLTLDPVDAERLHELYKRLVSGADLGAIAVAAEEMARSEPSLLAAPVLVAQVKFLRGNEDEALRHLAPVVDELPDYLAAALLAARIEERLARIPEAYERFADLASSSNLATQRAVELEPRASEIVLARFDDALSRGRFDDAEKHLSRLRSWHDDTVQVLEARWRLLTATGDREGELEVVRRLVQVEPKDGVGAGVGAEVERRLAELEVEIGDVRSGLEIFERLAAAQPADAELADSLERAKFIWRLDLLPPEVQKLGRQGELDRAELASLLYWLFPDVRYSQVDDPPIAADILEHPDQVAILRVLDLDLMTVDRALHRFRPEQPATRADLLAALLNLLMSADPPLSCLQAEVPGSAARQPQAWVCARAAGCALIDDVLACLPSATLSGVEALELVRAAQNVTGAR